MNRREAIPGGDEYEGSNNPAFPPEGHEPCPPVQHEYGGLSSVEILAITAEPGFSDIPRQIAHTALMAIGPSRQGVPVPSQRLREGCDGCVLTEACPVRPVYEELIPYEETMRQFGSAPPWLTMYRLHKAGMTVDDLFALDETPGAVEDALRQGFDFAGLLADARNERCRTDILPAGLNALACRDRMGQAQTHLITFEGAAHEYVFRVTDLTEINGFKGILASKKESLILMDKLVNTMAATSPDGRPAVMSADLLKPVRRFDGGYVAEVRMARKSRVYVAVMPDGDKSCRIFILGDHGGDAAEQQSFYDQTGISQMPR